MENEVLIANKFIDPEAIISQLDIAGDSTVADFGCGSGYFSIPIAKKLREGKLYSLDVLPSALESVESRAKIEGLTNITARRVNLENKNGSRLEKESLDWVILKDMLFQNKNKDSILKEAIRVLKPGGKILVIEWGDKETSMGPKTNLKIDQDSLKKMVQSENFKIGNEIDAGDFHYGFVASK